MASISTPNELHFLQSFKIDPKKQQDEPVQISEEITHDISFLGWENDSIKSKRFLVYMEQKALHFIILQENDVIFKESIFIDLENPIKFYFELYSESNYFFFLVCLM